MDPAWVRGSNSSFQNTSWGWSAPTAQLLSEIASPASVPPSTQQVPDSPWSTIPHHSFSVPSLVNSSTAALQSATSVDDLWAPGAEVSWDIGDSPARSQSRTSFKPSNSYSSLVGAEPYIPRSSLTPNYSQSVIVDESRSRSQSLTQFRQFQRAPSSFLIPDVDVSRPRSLSLQTTVETTSISGHDSMWSSAEVRSEFGSSNHSLMEQFHFSHDDEWLQNTICIRGLSPMTDDELRNVCKPYCVIMATRIVLDRTSQQVVGLVKLSSDSALLPTINALVAHGVHASAMPKPSTQPGVEAPSLVDLTNCSLIFINLPLDMDELQLESLLQPFGKVLSCSVLILPGGAQVVGMARFDSLFACQRAISTLHGLRFPSRQDSLIVKFSSPNLRMTRSEEPVKDARAGPTQGGVFRVRNPSLEQMGISLNSTLGVSKPRSGSHGASLPRYAQVPE